MQIGICLRNLRISAYLFLNLFRIILFIFLQIGPINNKLGPYFSYFEIGPSYFFF